MTGGVGVRTAGPVRVRSARARVRARGIAVLALVAGIGLLAALCGWQLVAAAGAQARAAALHARDVESTIAADSGLAWLFGRLHGGAVDAACEPMPGSAATFAERWLDVAGGPPSLRSTVVTPAGDGPAFACTRDTGHPDGWRCDCTGAASGVASASPDPAVAFVVRLRSAVPPAGGAAVVARAIGCVRDDADCLRPPRAGEPPARMLEAELAVVPTLVAVPSAVWTATRHVAIEAGASARNGDGASAGLVLHAGQGVSASGARLRGQSGAPPDEAVAADDAWLAAHDLDAIASRLLGASVADFAERPGVRRVACDGRDCGRAISEALARGARAVVVRGELSIDGPVAVGTVDRPVLVVVDGRAVLRGPASVHGLVLARDLRVDGSSGVVTWVGAGVSAGDLSVVGAVDAVRDAALLSRLAASPSAWLPAPGRWRDLGGVGP